MPIEIELVPDRRVVLQTYYDPLTAEDFQQLKERMDGEILPQSPHVLHIIADCQHVSSLPRTVLTSGLNMMNRAHPNTGIVICVTRSEFINAMARIFSAILSTQRVQLAKSLPEAYAKIDQLIGEGTP